jgi:adenylyltransferase/sulfurtransferase
MSLSDLQIERYSRQIVLPEVGGRGQRRLLDAAVKLVGGSGVAPTAALYLVAAGVGRIDWLPESGAPIDAWWEEARDLNPDVELRVVSPGEMSTEGGCHLVLSAGAASTSTANALALRLGLPLIAAMAEGSSGWLGRFDGRPCAECSELPPPRHGRISDDPAAIGVIGSLAALMVLRRLLGLDPGSTGTVLHYDSPTSTMHEYPVAARPDCTACALPRVMDT